MISCEILIYVGYYTPVVLKDFKKHYVQETA